MQYRIELARKAQKFLAKLPENIRHQIRDKIDSLEVNPRPHGCKRLQGRKDLYRVRTGDYRIIYTIKDNQLLVFVVQVGHRRDVYREK
jgi:mRNA interferase RelE/StbE